MGDTTLSVDYKATDIDNEFIKIIQDIYSLTQ